jgi:DNA-directed RNA polymerase specialized sigma24 family protein
MPAPPARSRDAAEEVALVALAKRELLLRVHRHRLRKEDLEDCYSQATVELIAHARRGGRFAGRAHLAHTLEQRFVSRIQDRRRAVSGRSPMQAELEKAVALGVGEQAHVELVDQRADPERLAILRHELRELKACAQLLTDDQRLVLAAQLGEIGCGEFCRYYGWSSEKYRKVAQRARARLRRLLAQGSSVPPACNGSEGWGTAYDDISPHP